MLSVVIRLVSVSVLFMEKKGILIDGHELMLDSTFRYILCAYLYPIYAHSTWKKV